MTTNTIAIPTLAEMRETHARIAPHVVRTPNADWPGTAVSRLLGPAASVVMKLELFQRTGTFKARGAISVALSLDPAVRAKGLTAASAGNHAIAVAWAAAKLGVPAKVVMQASANPFRIALARAEGANVILKPPGKAVFDEAARIAREDGMALVHPFEGPHTARGTATIGLELLADVPDLDAVVVAIGGGGLASGLATAIKALKPDCLVLGVEPSGADAMRRSFDAGHPVTLEKTDTIADSLAPPMTLPGGFATCRAGLDDLVTIDDDLICAGLTLMQEDAKLAVEPAAGAAAAALFGPYRKRLAGRRVGLIVCGANIDSASYGKLLARGAAAMPQLMN
ncbi:MAG: pyridoxal-phosphate dependent enzyme [Hyphomicrobiaceae bacterium]|nr:MAG: pyridoxal-phosphate dependent enzyme [Hyphomicrobiaceae bacterium]